MSYDLRLFEIPQGVDASIAFEQLTEQEEAGIVRGGDQWWLEHPLPATTRAQMQQLADALKARCATFVQFEPKSPLRWIELNDEELQVQVEVYENSVSITMPYFRESSTDMIGCIARCIHVCYELRGYQAFDPQLGRVVTGDDRDRIAGAYHRANAAFPEVMAVHPTKKRWWKFW